MGFASALEVAGLFVDQMKGLHADTRPVRIQIQFPTLESQSLLFERRLDFEFQISTYSPRFVDTQSPPHA
jgi:hypothetical protein